MSPELPAWPNRSPSAMKNALPLRCFRPASSTLSWVAAAFSSRSCRLSATPSTTSGRSSKTGLSLRFARSHSAKPNRMKLSRNGIRQPQLSSCSSVSTLSSSAQMADAARVPEFVPSETSEAMTPRRLTGAYSTSITVAPAISAPAPKP